MNRTHMVTFGPITLKENGIEYLYALLDKYPDVCPTVYKKGIVTAATLLLARFAFNMGIEESSRE